MTAPALIGVDWGSSSRRAWLLGAGGEVLERRRDRFGLSNRRGGDFAAELDGLIRVWPPLPAILAGMVGSRGGWVEAPYLPCPTTPEAIAGALAPVPGRADTFIVPGLSLDGGEAPADVLRGEETAVSALLGPGTGAEIVVLPGTHSKWVRIAAGRIESFRTFPTGELFAAVLDHTAMGALAAGRKASSGGFARGLDAAFAGDAGILGRLFSVRAEVLLGRLAAADAAGYLSGLLIGAEAREGLALFGHPAHVTIVANPELNLAYAGAFARARINTVVLGEDTAARGLWRLATAAGLVAPHL